MGWGDTIKICCLSNRPTEHLVGLILVVILLFKFFVVITSQLQTVSITSVLSKVFERLVSGRLGRCMERSGVLPTTQFAYRNGLGTCGALLCLPLTRQSAFKSGQEARIEQINFSAAFDKVNHQGILDKLCYVGIGSSVLSVLTQFLSNR